MNKIDWKEKAKEIAENNGIDINSFIVEGKDYGLKYDTNCLYNCMKEFAKLACEAQKEICAENADLSDDYYCGDCNTVIDEDTILNCETVKFD